MNIEFEQSRQFIFVVYLSRTERRILFLNILLTCDACQVITVSILFKLIAHET